MLNSWSGSAVVGGFIVDRYSFGANFLVTGAVLGTAACLWPLVFGRVDTRAQLATRQLQRKGSGPSPGGGRGSSGGGRRSASGGRAASGSSAGYNAALPPLATIAGARANGGPASAPSLARPQTLRPRSTASASGSAGSKRRRGRPQRTASSAASDRGRPGNGSARSSSGGGGGGHDAFPVEESAGGRKLPGTAAAAPAADAVTAAPRLQPETRPVIVNGDFDF